MKDEEKGDLLLRTKQFALTVIGLYSALPSSVQAQVIGKQFLRSGTSVGAHYHEAKHARSNNEFIAKIDLALQELSETSYWLELLIGSNIMPLARVQPLIQEAHELLSMLITISKKVKLKHG